MEQKDNEQVLVGRYSAKGYYDKRFIKQVVQEVEAGMTQRAAGIQFGVKAETVKAWLRQHGSIGYRQAHQRGFAPAVRRSVVTAVTQGRMSHKEARVAYGIKDRRTIHNWIAELKNENAELVKTKTCVVETSKPNEPSQDPQAAIEALKKQLEEAQLKIAALNTLIDVAEEQLKIDIRKKPGAKQS